LNLRRNFLLVACIMLIGCGAAPSGHSQSFTDDQREEIEQIISEYLVKHPQILEDMIVALEASRNQEAAEKAKLGLEENHDALFNPDPAVVAGNPDGDVTVIEFFDYRCGYCRASVDNLRKLIREDPNVRLILRDYPVLGPASLMASQAALAAGRQGRYVDFHWAIMTIDEAVTEESIFAVAEKLGLDIARMKKDMASDDIAEEIGENIKLADALGINGTPNFIFGKEIVPGAIPYEHMVELVKEARDGDDES